MSTKSERRRARFSRMRPIERIKRAIQSRFVVRFHMLLILVAVIASGVLLSKVLLACGVASLPVRWGLTVLGSYGVFFLCVRLWIAYVRAQLQAQRPQPGRRMVADLMEGVGDADLDLGSVGGAGGDSVAPALAVDTTPLSAEAPLASETDYAAASSSRVSSRSAASDEGGFLDTLLDGDSDGDSDGEGLIALIALLVLVAVIVGVSTFLIVQAPLILTEAAAQVILAESMRRRAKRLEEPGWAGHVLRKTIVPALIVLVVAVAAGAVIQEVCPGVRTVSDVWNGCI